MEKDMESLKEKFHKKIASIKDREELQRIRNEYIGRKGIVAQMLKNITLLSSEEKPRVGELLNRIKRDFQKAIAEKDREFLTEKPVEEKIDITIPGKDFMLGTIHPIELILKATEDIFLGMGFCIVDGPEVELDYYNFEALNIPNDHPSRDDQDSFNITPDIL